MANLKISELDAGTTPLVGDELVALVQEGATVRVPASALKGLQGDPGDDGREVELQKGTTHIQWRYVGDPTWTDLVSLDDITGPPGTGGAPQWDDIEGKPDLVLEGDSRLSDPRTPTGGAGGVLSGTFPNPGFAVDMATQGELDTQSTLLYAALDDLDAAKVDKVGGKGLSTEDYTTAEKTKLSGIATAATANSSDAALLARANHTGTQAISTVTGLQAALDAKIASTEKGAANGVASLGSDSKILAAQLPAIAITDVFAVASQAAMLALTAETGDIAVRSDLNKTFALSTNSPSTLADWIELKTPTDAVLSVAGRTGAVTLAKADVGLSNVDNTADTAKPVSTAQQTALDAKEGAIASGTTAQYWRGDKSWRDFATDVRAAVLTGLSTASSTVISATDTVLAALGQLQAQVSGKQATLVSTTNIKSINGNSILGSGDLTVSGGSSDARVVVRDEQTAGTSGGTVSSANTWVTRVLNTTVVNTVSGASLSSNAVTLPAGTYVVTATVPGYRMNGHKARLYNVTASAVLLQGSSEIANSADYPVQSASVITGQFTLASPSAVRIEHWSSTTGGGAGYGVAVGASAGVEVYTQATFQKVG